jgi:hypothetical protein
MKWYNVILIVVVLGILIFIQRKLFPEVKVITTSDTIFTNYRDTIVQIKPIPYLVESEPDTIEVPADSAKLVERYLAVHKELYTRKFYKDSTNVDSIGDIKVSYEVFRNSSENFKLSYNLKPATIINTTTITPLYNAFFVGLDYNEGITPKVGFNQKNRYVYSLGFNTVNKSLSVGFSININQIFKK